MVAMMLNCHFVTRGTSTLRSFNNQSLLRYYSSVKLNASHASNVASALHQERRAHKLYQETKRSTNTAHLFDNLLKTNYVAILTIE